MRLKRHLSIPSILLSAALASPGCAYVKDRGLDLAQSLDVAVGASEGLGFNLRVTKLAQLGIGGYRGLYWVGLKDGLFDVWQEERSEFGIGPLYVHEVFRGDGARLVDIRYPLFGDPGFREHAFDPTHLSDRGWFDIGATFNPVLFGFDLAFSPVEFIDFLGGLATFDMLEDDVYVPTEAELSRRLAGGDARTRAAAARALRLRTGERHGYVIWSAQESMPRSQITAIRRWRERLGTLVPPAPHATGATGATEIPEASEPIPAPPEASPGGP